MFIKKIVHRRKLAFSVLLLLSLAISAWMCYAPSASAHAMSGGPATLQHTYIGHTSLHTYVLCPGNGCNHQDPYATGCAASMYPVAIAPLYGGSVTGRVVLENSSVCQTNWDQIYSDNGVEYLAGCVVRKAGPDGPGDADCYSSTRFSWINTNMLWSPHNLDDAVDVLWISVVAVPWDRSPDTILRLDTIKALSHDVCGRCPIMSFFQKGVLHENSTFSSSLSSSQRRGHYSAGDEPGTAV